MTARTTIVILSLLQQTHAQPNPCIGIFDSAYNTVPGTGCKEYVQCMNQEAIATLTCAGDTVYDTSGQFCNWVTSVNCIDTYPPTISPGAAGADGADDGVNGTASAAADTQIESTDCPNPCYGKDSGYKTLPGTNCKEYVQCAQGTQSSETLSCQGDTIFNEAGGYCDWATSITCEPSPCPVVPVPTFAPVVITTEVPIANSSESTGMPSGVSSMELINGSSVNNGMTETTSTASAGNSTSNSTGTNAPSAATSGEVVDCSTPCPPGVVGFYVWPGTKCSKYAQCDDGNITKEFECPGGTMFYQEGGVCRSVDDADDDDTPYALKEEDICPEVICSDTVTVESTLPPETSSNGTDSVISVTIQHTTPQPSNSQTAEPKPISIYENMRKYLYHRKDIMNAIIFQSQYGPSEEYLHQDMMNALNVVVYQLPISLAFYGGENLELVGINYGLVNLAAFLANAMVEGIKTDSCDEWNTDDIDSENWKYPLANSCGQYGRSYQGEICREDVDSMCPIVKSMNLTALSSPLTDGPLKGPPPFFCRPTVDKGTFVGYYDSMTETIVQSAFANSVGRSNVEGCCWWGRGALLTRGRCIMGKLNKYLGKQAADAGYNSPYKYIDFCNDPNAICESYITRELRWTIAFLEWSDMVQNYVYIDDFTGNEWAYFDQLASFVDGGMVDNRFIDQVINILVRKCHDGTCNDNEITFEEERKNNFRRIIGEVFALPLAEDVVPDIQTRPPTNAPTPRPTRKNKDQLIGLPSNSAGSLWSFHSILMIVVASSLYHFL